MKLKLRSKNDWGRLDMTSEWHEVPLRELVGYISKGIAPSYAEEASETTIRVLNQKCNRNFRISYGDSRLHDTLKKKVPPERYVKPDDILINSTGAGTAGRIAQIEDVPSATTIDGHMILIRSNGKVTQKFLGYALKAHQWEVLQLDEGSTGQTELNRDRLLDEIMINYPVSFDEQNAIVGTLESIDRKLIVNKEINDNLYAQAKAIFDNHFINIDAIPAGWRKGNLLDIANYLNGLAMQKFRPQGNEIGLPVLKIKELRQGSCDDSSELCSLRIKPEYIIHDGDVIFSWSGSLLVDIWCGGTCGLNQHLFKVTSDIYDKWFYYLWTAHHLARFIAIAADKATTMGHIKREELAKAEVLIPCEEDYTSLTSIMQPIFELIISNRIEGRKLAVLRDELLPKLMSGEIDVSAVQL
jgi:type I restriction enzyme S subunit